MKIGIINYSIGNVGSVYSAFRFYGFDAELLHKPGELKNSDFIVLAGVGNFPTAVRLLKEQGFWDSLQEEATVKRKPVLGICLGMQLFSDISYEDGSNAGFGWIPGEVVKIEGSQLKVPHIGWNEVNPIDKPLFNRMKYNHFYYMHSYHFRVKRIEDVAAVTRYGELNLTAAVRRDNIVGVQFHPEKSQGDGLRFLANFIEVMRNDQ